MTIYFSNTTEMKGSSYVKIPLRNVASLKIQNDDKFCFMWSIIAHFPPIADSKNGKPRRVSNYRQNFKELNIQSCDFSNGFNCSDVCNFEKLHKLSVKKFELSFYQDQSKWEYESIRIQISKNNWHRVVDLFLYRNHYVLIKR